MVNKYLSTNPEPSYRLKLKITVYWHKANFYFACTKCLIPTRMFATLPRPIGADNSRLSRPFIGQVKSHVWQMVRVIPVHPLTDDAFRAPNTLSLYQT